ncbi:MAG: sialate O-acetylesterase [Algibacter sp.]
MKKIILILYLAFSYVYVNAQQFIPDPDEIYHIQAENGQYLASDGISNDAYTVASLSEANSSDDVEWQFVEQEDANGLWHIQRVAGGTRSRIRSDDTTEADMQASTSKGSWTQYQIEESTNFPGAHFLTTINSGHVNNRLELTTQKVSKTTEFTLDDGVSFRFTIVQDFFYEKIDYTQLYHESNGDPKDLPINVAHRGKWEDKNVPENSQASIQLAQNDNNIDWLEIDVKPSNIQLYSNGSLASLQPIIFHDDYPHRLISAGDWADNDLVYDNDMSGYTLSDRFGNETNEPLMTLEDFFQFITSNNITKPINLDLSNKSFLSNRIENGSDVVTDVYNMMFLKAVELIFEYNLNNQIFLKNTYAWDHAIWGLNATNTDLEGPNASVTSIMNSHQSSLGIMYTPKFGEETYNNGDDTVYWDPWLGIAKKPAENPHPATVVGFEVRLKKDDGEAVTYQLQTYINEAKDSHDGTEISINSGIFSEGTVACEGTWDNLARRKYVDFTQDRRNSVEWLDEKGYGYIITDFPDQLTAFKNRNRQSSSLGVSLLPDVFGRIDNIFSSELNGMNGGFSLSNILIPKNILGTDTAIAELNQGLSVIWRIGTTANEEIYIDRLLKGGGFWRVVFWEPRETGPFEDISNDDSLLLSVTVNDLETRIYIGTPDGKFDCMYLDYGFENSIMEGEFKDDADASQIYKSYNLTYGYDYQTDQVFAGRQVCRTDMFLAAMEEYFNGDPVSQILDTKDAFTFLNDENPYFSSGNDFQKSANEKAFDGEPTISCTSREQLGRRLDELEGNLYLIIGQSNAAGRGILPDVLEPYENVSVLDDNGAFIPALPNLNFYSSIKKSEGQQQQGYNLGYTFGGSMQHITEEEIKLVVNAKGGTGISQWEKGATDGFFEAAVSRVNEAIGIGNTQLAGIIWHQGESDRNSSSYIANLTALIADFREAFDNENLPFVVGELSHEKLDDDGLPLANVPFNSNLADLVSSGAINHFAVASAAELNTYDETHFDTQSLRDFGDSYALEMLKLQGRDEVLPEHLPVHPEIILAEVFLPDLTKVYHIKSLQGNLLAGDAGTSIIEDEASSVAGSTTGASVEWKFVAHEDNSGYHIDLNTGGNESRLYTKKDTEIASLTKNIFSGSNTYFFMQESNPGSGTYHITANDDTSGFNRLFLNPNGVAGMTDTSSTGTWSTFELIEVEAATEAETFVPDLTKIYHIKSIQGNLLAGDAETSVIEDEASSVAGSTIGASVEWKFVANESGTGYHIDLNTGGTQSRIYTDGTEIASLTRDIFTGTNTYFSLQEKSPGSGTYHITALDDTSGFNRLFLNPNGVAGMADTSSTGTWSTFEFIEVEAATEAEIFVPDLTKVYHIESWGGNLLAGDGSQTNAALETEAVAVNTTGASVEWRFFPNATNTGYHIDLVEGGEQSRLYTNGSGIASLTQNIFTSAKTYFVMEENTGFTDALTYHITAIDDTSGFNRLQLDASNGDTNMVTTASTNSGVSFIFNEVGSFFEPQANTSYHIEASNGHRLDTSGTDISTTTSASGSYANASWKFVKNENGYYHIDFSSEVFGIRRINISFQGVISLVDVSDVGSNTQFQMRESATTGSYFIQAPNGALVGKRLTFIDDGVTNTIVGNALDNADYVDFKIISASSSSSKASSPSKDFKGEALKFDTMVYPNPSSEVIKIKGLESNETLFIYDILGIKVLETTDKEVDISTFSNGVYFIKTEGRESVLKFIKK